MLHAPAEPDGLSGSKHKEVVLSKRLTLSLFVLLAVAIAVPSFAAPMPSKTAANQSLDSRAADIALVRDVTANEQVARVLTEHGAKPGTATATAK